MSEPGSQSQPDDALLDLLVQQVTQGLSPPDQRALDALDSVAASDYVRDLERAAAAISLAGVGPLREPSAALRERIAQQAASHFAAAPLATVGEHRSAPEPRRSASLGVAGGVRAAATSPGVLRRGSRAAAAGWFAAAACLLLAIFGWVRSPQMQRPVVADVHVAPPAPVEMPKPPPSAGEERALLLAKSHTLKIALGATKDPAASGVTGDAVWDPVTQKGFLHFVGLASNDPQLRQYQIWIFDADRDKRYPVDGGVFDVPSDSSEVVIPIRAALPVRTAKAFAVTVEKPGGVVVSSRGHVVVLGAAG